MSSIVPFSLSQCDEDIISYSTWMLITTSSIADNGVEVLDLVLYECKSPPNHVRYARTDLWLESQRLCFGRHLFLHADSLDTRVLGGLGAQNWPATDDTSTIQ